MSLGYIIEQLVSYTGQQLLDDRSRLLNLINKAAKEIYESEDLPSSLQEQLFSVPPDKQVALPYYIGEVRALREKMSMQPIPLKELRPRYMTARWANNFRNYRIKGESAIQVDLTSEDVLTVITPVPEPAIYVTITGSTVNSDRISEKVFLAATTQNTTNKFTKIHSIKKSNVNDYNIAVKDINGNFLAVVPNDQLKSRYIILDVSKFPNYGTSADGTTYYVEVLYKQALQLLTLDEDEFPCKGFDDAIVYKAYELYLGDSPGKETQIVGYRQKSADVVKQVIDNTVHPDSVDKSYMFADNQYYTAINQAQFDFWSGHSPYLPFFNRV